jgi:hypothetical protein
MTNKEIKHLTQVLMEERHRRIARGRAWVYPREVWTGGQMIKREVFGDVDEESVGYKVMLRMDI